MVSEDDKQIKIAILGATSHIARDLAISFSTKESKRLHLFARRSDDVKKWLKDIGLFGRHSVDEFSEFGTQEFDAILNFVGVGNPAECVSMGASIFDVTLQYDELALSYVRQHPTCRYVFLSSGAAYGSSFDAPVDVSTKAAIAINNLQPSDWYAVAKMHAECRHRSLSHLPITDIRVFNYFSHTQNMDARFLITDIVRVIRDKSVLKISADDMVRDFIGPRDFYQLINVLLNAPAVNVVVDCYSKAPIDKLTLLTAIHERFGLRYELTQTSTGLNATGSKPYYYSINKRANDFGYEPTTTSLESVLYELEMLFHHN